MTPHPIHFLKSNDFRRLCRAILGGLLPLLICLPAAAQPGDPIGAQADGSTGVHSAADRQGDAEAAGNATSSDWESRVLEEVAAREYEVTWQNETALVGLRGAWQAPNRAHNLRTYFTQTGIRVVPREEQEPSWAWGLSLLRFGRPGQETSVQVTPGPETSEQDQSLRDPSMPRTSLPEARWSAHRNRLDRDWGEIAEWYVNDSRGLEQGFTLFSSPRAASAAGAAKSAPKRTGEVHIDLSLTGTLDPSFSPDGQAIDFKAPGGAIVLRYAGLKVVDARGRELTARMEGFVAPGVRGIRLAFDDTNAVYPVTIDPLATTPAWTAESNQASAQFGNSVATAGDVNGDGYSDVIVGASVYDNGQTDEGRAFVYLGTPSGLAATPAWSAESNQAGALFGVSVATAGDVNGDGYSDVIVGASTYDNGQTDEGRAYVYLGSASGLATTPAWTAESDQASAAFGVSVATAGDVNGDGYSDVVVGARLYDNGQADEGRTFVYLGSVSGLATTPAWTAESNQAGANFGRSVSTAGDVNGDGYSDVVIGAYTYDNGQADEGGAFVYQGSASGLSPTPSWSAESDQANAFFGISVSTAGDVNGDGYSDIVVGAYQYDNGQADEGRAYVYLGSASGLATTAAWTAERDQVSASFGNSVAMAGDINGDGYSDVIIGANAFDNGQGDEGGAFVYLGSASGLAATPTWTAESDQASASFGVSVAAAGDVNGDGYSDVIVGAHLFDNGQADEGRTFVYLGSAAGLAATAAWSAESDQVSAQFGYSVATAGDINGDGYSDVIVGAWLYDDGQTDEGRAFVFMGSVSGLASTSAWSAESDQAAAHFGVSVAAAGDVNGDGYSDVIVGASDYDNGQTDEGRAYVYLGSPSGLATSPAWTAESDQGSAKFGQSVATAGDINGDGYSDVVVGAPNYDNGQTDEGRAYVYLGSASGLATTAAWTAESNQAVANFGTSVASAGDVNGDTYSDVIVGAYRYDNGQTDEGRAYLYLGHDTGMDTSPAWTAESNQGAVNFGALFGISVATAGDVNGDGYSDVIVGASDYDNGQTDEGRAYLYLGSPSGLATSAAWTAENNWAASRFGSSVATAGDINGDGYSDVIVGAYQYDNGESRGRVYVYRGSASGLAATPAWTADGDYPGARMGRSVATAGDVNGDGYSDVIVGAHLYANGETDEGRVFVYDGNNGRGLDRAPLQARANDFAPISLLGYSDSITSFHLRAVGRSPSGRSRLRLQWEVKPFDWQFDGTELQQSSTYDTGSPVPGVGSGIVFNELVESLLPGYTYHWRMRILSDSPFSPRSPWVSLPYNSPTEFDLRAPCIAPVGTPYLTATRSGSNVLLSWTAGVNAVYYDVVRGDLGTLHSTGGNFTAAINGCAGNNVAARSLVAEGATAPGNGFFFLVRSVGCGNGTYDSGAPSQVGLRDAEINSTMAACLP